MSLGNVSAKVLAASWQYESDTVLAMAPVRVSTMDRKLEFERSLVMAVSRAVLLIFLVVADARS